MNLLPFRITKDTKLRWFQYRVIHRILPTNPFLFKIKVVDSIKCSFCNFEDETYLHLFYECRYICKLLDELRGKTYFYFKVNFPPVTILLGLPGRQNDIFYLLALLFKQYIYFCRMKKTNFSIDALKAKITFYYRIEKYMYKSSNRYTTFLSRWGGWHDHFS